MSNETKGGVFEAVWNRLSEYRVFFNGWPREAIDEYKKRYNAALPDDLPVIPEDIGEYIEEVKAHGKWSIIDPLWRVGDALSAMGESGLGDRDRWVLHHSADFARAWVLGVWRVEETGEIVKVEAEK